MATRSIDSCDGVHGSNILLGFLDSLLVVLSSLLAVNLPESLLCVERLRERQEVLGLELEVVKVFLLGDVETVFTIQKLNHAAVRVTY